jgi:hypothetical protein
MSPRRPDLQSLRLCGIFSSASTVNDEIARRDGLKYGAGGSY